MNFVHMKNLLRKINKLHISPPLPLYRNWLIDYHYKSVGWCLYNNTGLKWVKWNSWRSCWSFKVRSWGKHNLNWTYIKHPYGVQEECLMYVQFIALLQRFHVFTMVLSLEMGHSKVINFQTFFFYSVFNKKFE